MHLYDSNGPFFLKDSDKISHSITVFKIRKQDREQVSRMSIKVNVAAVTICLAAYTLTVSAMPTGMLV